MSILGINPHPHQSLSAALILYMNLEVIMSEATNERVEEVAKEEEKESIGAYIGNVVLSMLCPIVALWYGPKYLLKGELVKGLVLILIVGGGLAIALSAY
jgi:hypothetical protein